MKPVMHRLLAVVVFLGTFVTVCLARPARSAEYPAVAGLRPFAAEANFMSLPGYLRFLVFQQDGTWLTRHEAVVAVRQQQIEVGKR